MTSATAEKRASFRALHESECFVLPNPWDAGSARMFQHLGFAALASTSSGYAWTTGQPDYAVTREDVLSHLRLCAGLSMCRSMRTSSRALRRILMASPPACAWQS